MIRRLAIAASLTILGAIGFASEASAQVSPTIDFNGTVASTCTFTGATAGTLRQRSATTPYLEAK
ncbi:MAG: hypothetical protein KME64_30750 [Scytonematopsis contorta HA4267-MV1]|nr:hypothetical protein [Scytonematopsis contorta HA4267-MV1]